MSKGSLFCLRLIDLVGLHARASDVVPAISSAKRRAMFCRVGSHDDDDDIMADHGMIDFGLQHFSANIRWN